MCRWKPPDNASCQYIAEQFRRFHRHPVRRQYTVMTDYILQIAQTQYKRVSVDGPSQWSGTHTEKCSRPTMIYRPAKGFYEWAKPEMFKMHGRGISEYADLAAGAYLHMAMEGYRCPVRM